MKRKAPTSSTSETRVYQGAALFRARLGLATLSARPVRIKDIRLDDESPGLSASEASFIRSDIYNIYPNPTTHPALAYTEGFSAGSVERLAWSSSPTRTPAPTH